MSDSNKKSAYAEGPEPKILDKDDLGCILEFAFGGAIAAGALAYIGRFYMGILIGAIIFLILLGLFVLGNLIERHLWRKARRQKNKSVDVPSEPPTE